MSPLPVMITSDDHFRGRLDAPLKVVQYADFECPYSAQAFWELERVRRMLGDQVCYAFRHFALTQTHPHALQAHEAAEAAGEQGRFWDMHRMLFLNPGALELPALYSYARELGLDMERFEQALDEHRYVDRIRRDFLRGIRNGVNRSPTIFINGVRHDGDLTARALVDAFRGGATVVHAY